jgi:hypothetical protein
MLGLGFQVAGWNTVVAVKLDVIECGSDAKPSRHGSELRPAHARHSGGDNVAESQGSADQDDLKLNRGANFQLPGTQEKNARRADVASNKGNRKLLGHAANAPQA